MNRSVPALALVLALALTGARAETIVYVANLTASPLAIDTRQTGARLADSAWRALVSLVPAGQRVPIFAVNRDAGITDGERFLFLSTVTSTAGGRAEKLATLRHELLGLLVYSALSAGVEGQAPLAESSHDGREASWTAGTRSGTVRSRIIPRSTDCDVEYVFDEASAPARADEHFRLLTYNVFLLPTTLRISGQIERAERIPADLPDCDVVVFNEAFDDDARAALKEGLRARWPHQSDVVGADLSIGQDGGVFIASKWPIVSQRSRVFDPARSYGNDRLAQKGVAYACVQRPDGRFHVFGTHLQADAGEERAGTRAYQLEVLAGLIRELRIPAGEPVLVAGDMNVARADAAEHAQMLAILRAHEPAPWIGHPFTSDPGANSLNGDDHPSVFDYVLWSKDHLAPAASACTTLALTAREPVRWREAPLPFAPERTCRDLSDHYPVLGTFLFRRGCDPRAAAARTSASLLGLGASGDLRSVRQDP